MSATARLVKAGGAPRCAETPVSREEVREEAEAVPEAPVEARPAPGTGVKSEAGTETETAAKPVDADPAPARGRKGITYRGQCIFCGERIEIAVDRREIACFAFCNPECKAKFEAEMNRALD